MGVRGAEDRRRGRADLSLYLVHLCRGENARRDLLGIMDSGDIQAKRAWGIATEQRQTALPAPVGGLVARDPARIVPEQRVACFTETPLSQLRGMMAARRSSDFDFRPYGVAIPMGAAIQAGACPVWYVTSERVMKGVMREIIESLNAFKERRNTVRDLGTLSRAPYFEYALDAGDYMHQREWRAIGGLKLPEQYLVLAPASDHQTLREHDLTHPIPFIDIEWTADEAIWRLAQFDSSHLYQGPSRWAEVADGATEPDDDAVGDADGSDTGDSHGDPDVPF